MIKVCHITTVHPPFNTRIFHKECKTPAKSGYEVYLIVTHDKEEMIDGVHIIPLPERKGRFYRFLIKDRIALFKALKINADIYHFHDPELIIIGLILKILGKKVIRDVHEDVPKQIMNKRWIRIRALRKVVSFVFAKFEILSSKFLDYIIAATPDIAERFPLSKTITIRNFPILSLIDKTEPAILKKEKHIIIYAGGLARIRGIKEIVQAMEHTGDKAELWLLGKWGNEKFKKECENLKGWKYTKYLGLKSLKEVYSYMKVADIGISTLYPIENYLTSLPVKAFEYMACRLPMIMSNFPYWEKMFKSCAIFVDPQNPEDIAEKINILLDNKNLRTKLGKAGRDLTDEKYSWENEGKKLIELYRKLSNKDIQ